MQINGENRRDAADAGVAPGKDAPISSAVSYGDDPFRARGGVVGALECFAHVDGDRTRHHEYVSMTWRSNKTQTESLEIVDDVVAVSYTHLTLPTNREV